MWRYAFFGLCLFQFFGIAAQTVPTYRHVRLNHVNGLRHDNTNVFLGSDSEGYLWIGSDGGAYRFDGQSITRFFTGEPNFKEAVKSSFIEDDHGSISYGTPSGIVNFDMRSGALSHHPLNEALSAQFGYHLIGENSNDSGWLISNGSTLYSIDKEFKKPLSAIGQSHGVRYMLLNDSDKILSLGFPWLLNPGIERISIVDADGNTAISTSNDPILKDAVVNGGVQVDSQTAWLTSNLGLIGYNIPLDSCFAVIEVPGSYNSKVWDVIETDSLLLVASDQDGLWWFDPWQSKFLKKLSSCKPELTESPRALHISDQGQILVARTEGGVDILVPQRFNVEHLISKDLTYGHAASLVNGTDGTCWILTPTGELYRYSNDTIDLLKTLKNDDEGYTARHLVIDQKTKHLISVQNQTLLVINEDDGEILLKIQDLPERVRSLFVIDSLVMLATEDGLFQLNDQKLVALDLSQLPQSSLADFHPLDNSEIAFYTGDTLVYITTIDNKQLLVVDSVHISGEFLSISRGYANDQLLIGTTKGLNIFKKTEQRIWASDTTLLNDITIRKTSLTTGGQIWVATDGGLGLLNSHEWSWLTREHGLLDDQLTVEGLVVLENGQVVLSSKMGVSTITENPIRLKGNSRTVLSHFWLDGVPEPIQMANTSRTLEVQQHAQDLQFQFSTVGIFDQQPPRVSYCISCDDDSWRVLGEDRMLRLEPLPVGEHTLMVRAQAADQSKTETLRIPITITIPYWETWWFKLFVLLTLPLIVGLVSFSIYRRKINIAKKELDDQFMLASERERIARDLHDDLGTDLSTILFLSEDLLDSKDPDREKITNLSRNALSKMREIVWTMSGKGAHFQQWVEQVLLHCTTQCKNHEISFIQKTELSSLAIPLQLDRSTSRELTLLMREALENAIRHGHPNEISLFIRSELESEILLTLTDNGQGFDPSNVSRGLGLSNLHQRAKRLGGSLTIDSNIGQGTTITLRVAL